MSTCKTNGTKNCQKLLIHFFYVEMVILVTSIKVSGINMKTKHTDTKDSARPTASLSPPSVSLTLLTIVCWTLSL